MYQSEIKTLQEENNVVCGVGERLYTFKNVSLLKKKIKNNEKIPETKTFVSKVSEMCEKM